MKIAAKFELLELKIAIFSKNVWFWTGNVTFFFRIMGSCERTCASIGGLVNGSRGVKRGSWGRHIPVPPFQVSVPPHCYWRLNLPLWNCSISVLPGAFHFGISKYVTPSIWHLTLRSLPIVGAFKLGVMRRITPLTERKKEIIELGFNIYDWQKETMSLELQVCTNIIWCISRYMTPANWPSCQI